MFSGCRPGGPCQFVMHGEESNSPQNDVFRSIFNLPDDIPDLPLSQVENLPVEYYLHEGIPEEYRDFFYEGVLEWNTSLKHEVFTIKGIDHNEIDPIDNRKDQKNVIYWFSEDQLRDTLGIYNRILLDDVLSIAHTFPMINVEGIDNSSSYLKISDADIIINERFITDVEFVRFFLLKRLKYLGVEVDDVEDIEMLLDKIITYWEAMSIEDTRRLAIRELEGKKSQFLKNGASRGYIEEAMDFLNGRVLLYTELEDIHLASIRNDTIHGYQNIYPEKLKNGNTILRDTILHELGHGLGLDHYYSDEADDYRPLMSNRMVRTSQDLMLTSRSIDDHVHHSLSCTYNF